MKITSPPWSHSISQSALTVTSARVKGFRSEVKTIGAVAMSPVGGLRQRLVLGPAVREKYSMQSGRVKDGGRFRVVKEAPVGGIFALVERRRLIHYRCFLPLFLAEDIELSSGSCWFERVVEYRSVTLQ